MTDPKVQPDRAWAGIGQFDTPPDLVRAVGAVARRIALRKLPGAGRRRRFCVLDLFAGDGRLGAAACRELLASNLDPRLELVECDTRRLTDSRVNGSTRLTVANVFQWVPRAAPDLVVLNPPFMRLTKARAEILTLPWADVQATGPNLYLLGLSRALGICRWGGSVVAIAPFGWLTSALALGFRRQVSDLCSSVTIVPERSRSRFRGVHQDIAIQTFVIRSTQGDRHPGTRMFLSGRRIPLLLKTSRDSSLAGTLRIRVGTVVWNRERERLSSDSNCGVPVVYGGDISERQLSMDDERYGEKRFYGAPDGARPLKGPIILIRRVLRGGPGHWKIDACLVTDDLQFLAENHVISVVVEDDILDPEKVFRSLVEALESSIRLLAHPSLSVRAVKEAAVRMMKGSDDLVRDL